MNTIHTQILHHYIREKLLKSYKYKAFISYSHKDARWGRWLHRRLETYNIPNHLVGNTTSAGIVPKRLRPIFRDREDLAAANSLGETIEHALAQSENLIIICSPDAAKSQWVNQEILSFKRQNRDAKIFSLIVDGTPFAQGDAIGDAIENECLPKALRFQTDENGELTEQPAEPLAADIRPNADGKRLGLLKLISGLIGTGLDELVQRDMHRLRNRVMAITASSLTMVLAMAMLTGFALDARKEAELRRNDAEGQIEFMLTDLKDKLEPVGRLDALQVVGENAANYYDKYPLSEHDDDALGRRARVFHYLGELQDKLGNLDEADTYFQKAYVATQDLLARDPGSLERIYEHSQSAFWVGYPHYRNKDYQKALHWFQEYNDLANVLVSAEPENLNWLQEKTYSLTNLGTIYFQLGDHEKAMEKYQEAIPIYESIVASSPKDVNAKRDLGNVYAWIADTQLFSGPISNAIMMRDKQIAILKKAAADNPSNKVLEADMLSAYFAKASLLQYRGDIEPAKRLLAQQLNTVLGILAIDASNTAISQYVPMIHGQLGHIEFTRGAIDIARVHADTARKALEYYGLHDASNRERHETTTIPILLLRVQIDMYDRNYSAATQSIAAIKKIIGKDRQKIDVTQSEHNIHTALLEGDILQARGQVDKANTIWQSAIDSYLSTPVPLPPDAFVQMILLYERLNQQDSAQKLKSQLKQRGIKTGL